MMREIETDGLNAGEKQRQRVDLSRRALATTYNTQTVWNTLCDSCMMFAVYDSIQSVCCIQYMR